MGIAMAACDFGDFYSNYLKKSFVDRFEEVIYLFIDTPCDTAQ